MPIVRMTVPIVTKPTLIVTNRRDRKLRTSGECRMRTVDMRLTACDLVQDDGQGLVVQSGGSGRGAGGMFQEFILDGVSVEAACNWLRTKLQNMPTLCYIVITSVWGEA